MDEDQKQQNSIDEAIFAMPEEVKDFMWSDLYEIIIDSIKEGLKLTDPQRGSVKQAGYDLLMGLKTMPEAGEELITSGMTPELTAKVLYALNEEIIGRATNITEFYSPDDTENESISTAQQAPSPVQALASIKERLSQASIIAPTKRDYSIERTETPTPPSPNTPKPIFDIYREPPTK